MALIVVICLLLAFLSTVEAIPTIHALGSKFFTSEGHQWYVKGVAYQLIEDDPLVKTEQCERDATLMHKLGANAIRVYHVNESAEHSGCMNAFASHGIYVFVDLDSFKTYIRFDSVSSWDQKKADSYRAVMDNFQQYDNTAGFFIGNEVLNSQIDSHAAPYLLAAAVDMKKYRDARGYRKIPIGYSATDTGALRPMLQDYAVCRPTKSERMDFFAVNTYSWCGPQTTYNTSGYPMLQELAQDYPVPIWMSEVGCNTVPPRTFEDQKAVFGPEMVDTWSGAMIYEWIQELNDYGLVTYGPVLEVSVQVGNLVVQGFTREGVPTPVEPDFANLQRVWATITPSSVDSSAYAATFTTKAPACPKFTADGWSVDPNAKLPTLGASMINSGMPSGVPKGSITATGTSSGLGSVSGGGPGTASPTGSSGANEPLHSEASGTHGGDSLAPSTAGAVRLGPNPSDPGMRGYIVVGMLAVLTAVVSGFGLLL